MNPLAAIDKLKRDYVDFLRASFPIRATLPYLSAQLSRVTENDGELFRGPYLELTPPYRQGTPLRCLVSEGILHPGLLELAPERLPPDRPLYMHQERSIRTAANGENVCVAAGTGAGKTECFLIPIVDYILKARDAGVGSGVKAVLMYPMNALVEDQLARLRRLLSGSVGRTITFGRYTGLTRETESDFRDDLRSRGLPILPNEIGSRERLRQELPDILMTNFSMLQYLLLRPRDRVVFDNRGEGLWRFLVLDELHTYRGVQGIEVGMLLRRFMHRIGRLTAGMQCFATSATLSSDAEDEALLLEFLEDVFSHSFRDGRGTVIRGEAVSPDENHYYDAPEEELFTIPEAELLGTPGEFFERELSEWAAMARDDCATSIASSLFQGREPTWFGRLRQSCESPLELLYEVGRRNQHIHRIVADLTANPVLTVNELAARLGMVSPDAVRRLIRLGTVARPSVDAHPLVSARYHFFVRGPQGARACLNEQCPHNPPVNGGLLSERTTLTGAESCRCGHALYEIGICRNCGQPYVIGYLAPNGSDFFAVRDDAGERTRRYIAPRSEIEGSEYSAMREANIHFCSEQDSETVRCSPAIPYAFVAREDGVQTIPVTSVAQCFRCGGQSRASGDVVSGFASEGDIAQIVILQSMLQAQGRDPKALVFSDSRQGAAKFAVTLNYTSKSALTRQLILRLLEESAGENTTVQEIRQMLPNATDEMIRSFMLQAGHDPDAGGSALGLDDLGRCLRRSDDARAHGLYSEVDMEDNYDIEARSRIYAEFATMLNRRLSLSSLGLCKREVELQMQPGDEDYLLNLCRPLGIETRDDARSLVQLLLGTLVDQAVVDRESRSAEIPNQYPVLLPAAPFQHYAILDGSGRRARQSEISWLPRGTGKGNSRSTLLEKLARQNGLALSPNDLRQVLVDLFAFLNTHGAFEQVNGNGNVLALRRVRISQTGEAWQCEICGHRTFFPIALRNDNGRFCPAKDCRGRLAVRATPVAADGFYERLYLGESLIRVVAKEHTAQLGENSTRKYQDSFADETSRDPNRINVLSCSTTFEMGVDLGDLSMVFMRNIPPEVANYRQRSGRAGRRSGQEAMICTFARSRSHDAYYFAQPERMIAGQIRPPALNMGNRELRRRHVNAFFMADYLRELGLAPARELLLGDIWPPAELGILPKDFQRWQDLDIPSLRDSCTEFACSLGEERGFEVLVGEFVEDLRRIGEGLVREREDLERRRQQLSQQLAGSSDLRPVESALQAIRRELGRLAHERLIDFLVKNQVLPGFGFPVHVVELDTRAENLDLTRDKSIALFEYAPGNTVVADGYAIPSVGLKDSYFREEEQFYYRICCDCGHAEVKMVDSFAKDCGVCGTDLETPTSFPLSPKHRMLIPVGFTSDTSQMPRKAGATISPSYHRRQSFVRFPDEGAEGISHPAGVYTTVHAGDAELYVVNTGEVGGNGFRFCHSCKRLVPKGTRHQRPYGGDCRSQFFDEQIHLGHTFRTDAVRIRFAADRIPSLPPPAELGFWRSLSYAVLRGAVIELQVERNDLGAIVQPYSAGAVYGQEIILYDAVPGGAGYCRYFRSHERIERILMAAYQVVTQCDCDPESSCHRCLRAYDNSAFHRQLRRGPVAEMLARTLAVMQTEATFTPFGNAAYFIGRQLAHPGRRVTLALACIPTGSPQGDHRPWVDLLAQNGNVRILVADKSLTRDWIAANPKATFAFRTLLNLLSSGCLDLRTLEEESLPSWNVVCEADDESAAISLRDADFGASNTIEKWTYRQDEVTQAADEFNRAFSRATNITADVIQALLSPIQIREIPQGSPINMRDDLDAFYRDGARITAAFFNDRYLVDCQFDSLAEHLKLVRSNSAADSVPVLVFTEWPRDGALRSVQRDHADAIQYRFPGTRVQPFDHFQHMVEHQRFVILAREDGTFSRLTMDPGIDVIGRHQRDDWPSGPVFQRTEIYYVRSYQPTGMNPQAMAFLGNSMP